MQTYDTLINKIIEYLNYLMQDKNVGFIGFLSANIDVILPSTITLITVIWTINSSRTSYKRNIKEKEYEKCNKKLEEFYYPFLYLLGLNTSLYSCFALKEKAKDNNFRTLIALIKKHDFSATDKMILDEIINNNKEINKLILEKGLYVEKTDIRKKLIQLSTHYTVIDLAYNGKIDEYSEEYDKMVFPRGIHESISAEIQMLEDKLKELR